MSREGVVFGWSIAAAVAAAVGASVVGNSTTSVFVPSVPSVLFWALYALVPASLLVSAIAGARMLSVRASTALPYALTGFVWLAITSFWILAPLAVSERPAAENLFLLVGIVFALSVVGAFVSAIIIAARPAKPRADV